MLGSGVTRRTVDRMSRLRHIAVDLTPLGPRGQNGGAGLVATSLVREINALEPDLRLTLLTAGASHDELSLLESPTVRRMCVVAEAGVAPRAPNVVRGGSRRVLDRLAPAVRVALAAAYERILTSRGRARLLRQLQPDLLFCPFTVPYFHDPTVPLVSVVYDLQHLVYPEFFTPQQRAFRQQHIRQASARSARLVAISDFVRQALLASVSLPPERVMTVHLGLLDADASPAAPAPDPLGRLGLRPEGFVLYPANFWPHKNHVRLFEALRDFRARRPGVDLKLVCTGSPNALMAELEQVARSVLPPQAVVFAGYLTRAELRGLLQTCRALVFPSLFEGFGMPVIEALAMGKPVLCSNVTSLPEVAGDAAVYFDPLQPGQIADALVLLEDAPDRLAAQVERGRARAARFGSGRDMAARYLDVFEQVVAERQS